VNQPQTQQTHHNTRPPAWRWLLWWLAAHVLAAGVGITLLRLLLPTGDWPLAGAVLGIVQVPLLLQRLLLPAGWAAASALAGLLGSWLGSTAQVGLADAGGRLASLLVFGLIYGLLLGIAQWPLLRVGLARAGWWLLVSPLSVALGTLAAVAVNGLVRALWGEGGDGAAAWAAFGLVYGGLTGGALLWLDSPPAHRHARPD
jgi:hypothetical protein